MEKYKIEIGRLYKDKWGSSRIPIKEESDNTIRYIEAEKQFPFVFNPYKGFVKIDSFKKWTPQEFKLSEEQVEKLDKETGLIRLEWSELVKKSCCKVWEVIKYNNVEEKFNAFDDEEIKII